MLSPRLSCTSFKIANASGVLSGNPISVSAARSSLISRRSFLLRSKRRKMSPTVSPFFLGDSAAVASPPSSASCC